MANTSFLDLANETLRRINEVPIAQADFTSVRGPQALAKDAVNASIQQILNAEPRWPFTAVSGTQLLTPGIEEYDWPTNMKIPKWNSMAIQRSVSLNIYGNPLMYISRDVWLQNLRSDDESTTTSGRGLPQWCFEKHGFGFGVSPSPDQAYTVLFDYWPSVAAMAAYDDITVIPTAYNETIIQGALYHFYMFRQNDNESALCFNRFKMHLETMRTNLVNKEDRMIGSVIARGRRASGLNAIPSSGWYF